MVNDTLTINVLAYIRQAAADPAMRAKAAPIAANLIADALGKEQKRKNEIRPSDFGSCRLALWAAIHDKLDLPRDPIDDQLTRLDFGQMVGAWEAALLKVAAEADGWDVTLEFEPLGGGHIDALCRKTDVIDEVWVTTWHVVEFKSQYDTGAIAEPKETGAHKLQSGDYANRVYAERATLVYIKPAGKKGARMAQFEFDAEPYKRLVAIERDRLSVALLDDQPEPDPQEKWQCWTCLFGACAKNKSKSADSADVLFA
jgi:hypothetical protein